MTNLFLALVSQEVPNEEVLSALLALVGGVKGASGLAIVALSVQLLMKFFGSSLANFAGKYKLLIVSVLSLGGAVVASMVQGSSLVNALVNGSVLTAVQVLGSQVYIQFFKKGE